jgi:iron complex transport system permease protein
MPCWPKFYTENKNKVLFLSAGLVLMGLILLSLRLGAVRLDPFKALWQLTQGGDMPADSRILLYVRLPRMAAAVLCGGGLAISGCIIQTVLNNPLAAPSVIGVNAGAGLFTVLWAVLLPDRVGFLSAAAFLGALLTVLLVYGIASKAGASRLTLILSGVAISSLMSAGINTVTTLYPDALSGMHSFQIGGFAGVNVKVLLPAAAVILLGMLAVFMLTGELDILGLGEETARSLGLNVPAYRFIFLILAAALCGAAVSFSGLIGFVGLIVPHMARMLVRDSQRTWLGLSALVGASFLLLCDTFARTAFAPFELPVGILIAFLGVPFFLWLLFREKRRRHG